MTCRILLVLSLLLASAASAARAQVTGPTRPNQLPAPVDLPNPGSSVLNTKAKRARFHTDSLRLAYPVDSAGRACWKFTEPATIAEGKLRCYRGDDYVNEQVDRGNLHTYFRGAWRNWIVSDRPGVIIMQDGTRSDSASVRVSP